MVVVVHVSVGHVIYVDLRSGRRIELFGSLQKKVNPYKAMLAARCVEVQSHGGDRSKSHVGLGKVTLTEFAELAGIGKATVDRYLKAWDAMASAGLVSPRAHSLRPGVGAWYWRLENWGTIPS